MSIVGALLVTGRSYGSKCTLSADSCPCSMASLSLASYSRHNAVVGIPANNRSTV